MRRVLFLFLDGVGFGIDDPTINPLVAARYPTLELLTDGAPLVAAAGRYSTELADIIPLDACMGVNGKPQSATGQASLLTGKNIPAAIGEHYGPRPDDRIRELVLGDSLFSIIQANDMSVDFCNAYPPGFFVDVERGKRLLSVIQFAAASSGLMLHDEADLAAGLALSADYTNSSWRDRLEYEDVPVYSPHEAGDQFWELAQPHSFLLHDHWITDEIGHHQDMGQAVELFTVFDGFLAGLLDKVHLPDTLIVIASDHGNVEDCSHGKHTLNPALFMLIGNREGLPVHEMRSLYDVAPIVIQFLMGAGD